MTGLSLEQRFSIVTLIHACGTSNILQLIALNKMLHKQNFSEVLFFLF